MADDTKTYTPNYNLVKPGQDDFYNVEDFNGNADKIDNGLKSLKTKLDTVEEGAQVNQNAFSTVKVGATNIQADAKTDTLELAAGANISLTPDAANDKVTIAVTGTVPQAGNANTVGGMQASEFLPKTGGTLTGGLIINSNSPSIRLLETDTGKTYFLIADGNNFSIRENATDNAPYALLFNAADGNFYIKNNKIWHAGNMGAGSNLNADLFDDFQLADLGLGTRAKLVTGSNMNDLRGTIIFAGYNLINAPNGFTGWIQGFNISNGTDILTQIVYDTYSTDANKSTIYVRHSVNGGASWELWKKFWHSLNSGSGSGLDAGKLEGQEGSYYRNASNLNAGTLPAARLPALSGDVTSSAGSASVTLNAAAVLAKLKTVDGPGSGLEADNADTVDGKHASDFALAGSVTVTTGEVLDGGIISIPSGFIKAQCKYLISVSDSNPTNIIWDPEDNQERHRLVWSVDPTTWAVSVAYEVRLQNGTTQRIPSKAQFMVVGVK